MPPTTSPSSFFLLLMAILLFHLPSTHQTTHGPKTLHKELLPHHTHLTTTPLLLSLTSHQPPHVPQGINMINFCKNCVNPNHEGSSIHALRAYNGPEHYDIQGELVYALPNTGVKRLLNAGKVLSKIVLFNRGEISVVEKVLLAQSAGALAVIIIDTQNTCENDINFLKCGRLGSASDGGYARFDDEVTWRKVVIPSFIVTFEGGQRIVNVMHLEEVAIPGLGGHWRNVAEEL